jgi:hypothetical protein
VATATCSQQNTTTITTITTLITLSIIIIFHENILVRTWHWHRWHRSSLLKWTRLTLFMSSTDTNNRTRIILEKRGGHCLSVWRHYHYVYIHRWPQLASRWAPFRASAARTPRLLLLWFRHSYNKLPTRLNSSCKQARTITIFHWIPYLMLAVPY